MIGHSPDQVLQADDAHQLVLADDRRAGDLSSPQQLEQVGHVVVRTYFEQLACHHLADLQVVRQLLDPGDVVGILVGDRTAAPPAESLCGWLGFVHVLEPQEKSISRLGRPAW